MERSLGAWGRSYLARCRGADDGASVPADATAGRGGGGTLILGSPGPSWTSGFKPDTGVMVGPPSGELRGRGGRVSTEVLRGGPLVSDVE